MTRDERVDVAAPEDVSCSVDEQFWAMVCADEELLGEQFEAIIAAGWRSPPRLTSRGGADRYRSRSSTSRAAPPVRAKGRGTRPGPAGWTRQRAPPNRAANQGRRSWARTWARLMEVREEECAVTEHRPGQLGGDFDAVERDLSRREDRAGSLTIIEQAKGMLLQDFGVTDEEATEVLVTLAHETDTSLAEVAGRTVRALTGSASTSTSRAASEALGQLSRELAGGHAEGEGDTAAVRVDPTGGEDLRSQIVGAMERVQSGRTINDLARELGARPSDIARLAGVDTTDWSTPLDTGQVRELRARLASA